MMPKITAWDLLAQYMIEYPGLLPLPGEEYEELAAYARMLNVDTPEQDSIMAVCQMLRQRRDEALRQAGQMVLL